jgi:hypothetical protein
MADPVGKGTHGHCPVNTNGLLPDHVLPTPIANTELTSKDLRNI